MKNILVALLALHIFSLAAFAQGIYDDQPANATRSPKDGWQEFDNKQPVTHEPTWVKKAILWLPNRILDFIDVFRADIGVGPSVGAVVRATRYAQAGSRTMAPLSVRFGLMGRRSPVMFERSNELGISPAFLASKDRKICRGEFGAGLDLIIVGGYLGICTDEVVDLVAGIFTFDINGDDIQPN